MLLGAAKPRLYKKNQRSFISQMSRSARKDTHHLTSLSLYTAVKEQIDIYIFQMAFSKHQLKKQTLNIDGLLNCYFVTNSDVDSRLSFQEQ